MVGGIYFIEMPYSDFKHYKGRPVLVFRVIDKNDVLVLPLTSNLHREGIVISNDDIKTGALKKESVVIVPKITAIDSALILDENSIATLKSKTFEKILKEICHKFEC
ncbi:type II toxin-antitoxin system PemK/MazF family toxin [bacterium]|nr:type II toxin-antitoxin system PemK/MazF family toxin [bacterium]MBU1957898.1 type II toxin-antitoxin system PemK/MazF family toxin [bacterium]